jgi:hypothetical protein
MCKPLALLVLLLVATTALAEDISAEHLSPSRKPGQNFNLSKFKLQLPVAHGNGVVEIPAAQLPTYTSEYFYTDKTTGAMIFWVPTDGAHTSGSKFPRTELRQNTDFTISTGSTSLTVTVAVLQTPKRNNIVVGQLKGENEQPIELRWIEGDVVASVKTSYKQTKPENLTLASGLKEGRKFTYTMALQRGVVTITVNGSSKKVTFDKDWDADKVYWKFGNYCQDNSKTAENAAKVAVFAFTLK